MDATARRRWLGGLVLLGAMAMLVAGETVLKGRLGAAAFLGYWLICLALTGVAVLVALWDLRALRRRTQEQQRDLLQTTLDEIETDARSRRPPNPGS